MSERVNFRKESAEANSFITGNHQYIFSDEMFLLTRKVWKMCLYTGNQQIGRYDMVKNNNKMNIGRASAESFKLAHTNG